MKKLLLLFLMATPIQAQLLEIDREEYEQDEKHKYNFTFLTYEKEIQK